MSFTSILRLSSASLAVTWLATGPAGAQPATSVPAVPAVAAVAVEQPAPPQKPAPPALTRWVDLQVASIGIRYRLLEPSTGVASHHGLYGTSIKGGVKLDPAGRFTVAGSLATGTSGTSGWNNTGLGSASGTRTHSVKELFVGVVPATGVTLQAGSLGFARGETTEAIGFDTDFYVMGERVTLARPKDLFFDQILVTTGFVGELTTPGVFRRTGRMGDWNYYQVMAAKKLTARVRASAEYSALEGIDTVRTAVRVSTRELRVVDWARIEAYGRLGGDPLGGFALHAEKAIARASIGGGFADVDPAYGTMNGDRYGKGRRVYVAATVPLIADFSAQVWAGRAVATDFAISNRTRVDVTLSYDALASLRRARLF